MQHTQAGHKHKDTRHKTQNQNETAALLQLAIGNQPTARATTRLQLQFQWQLHRGRNRCLKSPGWWSEVFSLLATAVTVATAATVEADGLPLTNPNPWESSCYWRCPPPMPPCTGGVD
jgi:hypothetical protein